MSTIIVASDGSERAVRAGVSGLALLGSADRVIVAAVVDGTYHGLTESDIHDSASSTNRRQSPNLRDERMAEGERAVDQTSIALSRTVDTRVIEGNPGIALCELANEVSADAIVMGSRGHGAIRRAVLGSVSDYVVRHSPCPVLIVGEDPRGLGDK
jgi:nucleotide-binding universal stress UspA family protein